MSDKIWPTQPIWNAANVPLSSNPGTLPNMSNSIKNWFQLVRMERITKTVDSLGILRETGQPMEFQGIVQTRNPRHTDMKPEGQRRWKQKSLIAFPSLILAPDDVVLYENDRYRVAATFDWKQYGYVEYYLEEDYTS